MNILDTVLLIATLIILAEATYLVTKLKTPSMKTKGRAILVDTSVLIDGRIINLASTGFISGTLVIPRSVVGELQFLADNADADKRARARHGLDIMAKLQAMERLEVELLQDGSKAEEGVDERLLTLAKRHGAAICTLDFNLNKVAIVEGIEVLNINELAQSLRMSYLPGERMFIELTQKGQDQHQGVGYLSDGTMVVVEQSSSLKGQTVEVEVVRSLQTAAGKMMFAKRVDAKAIPNSTKKQNVPAKQKLFPTPASSRKMQPTTPTRVAHEGEAPKQKPSRQYARRPKTSREDDLISLVNSQKD